MLIFGHRGVRKKDDVNSPYQNTIAAFEQAFTEGAEGIELDVILSKDNNLIVIHDNELEIHSKNIFDKISELNLPKIKNIRVGNFNSQNYGDEIPTLSEVFDTLNNKYSNKHLNIELKGTGTAKPVFDLLQKTNFNLDNIIVSSFNHEMLHEFYKYNQKIKIGVLIAADMLNETHTIETYLKPFLDYKSFYSINIEDVLVDDLKKLSSVKHKKIYVWSMSDEKPTTEYIKKLYRQKIDCLITDYPKLAIDILKSL